MAQAKQAGRSGDNMERQPTTDNLGIDPKRMELIHEELEEHGVAVVPGVLTEDECDDYITQLHQWFRQFGENDFPKTNNSIIHTYNIAHHAVAWNVRLKAAPVFKALWGTEKLVSSIDGMAIGHPPELRWEHFGENDPLSLNLHLDQGGRKVGLHAYQGAVYLEEAETDDWCFAVMDRSHLYHDKYFKERKGKLPKSEHLRLTLQEVEWYINLGCPVQRIAVPKGGMVLWDSRIVHSGARPLPDRKNAGRWRYVVFVCMAPAHWASDEEIKLKRHGFHRLRCSRHWPAQGFELFSEMPMPHALNAVNELPAIALTKKARLLAGDLLYDDDGMPQGPPKPKMV